MRPIFIDTEEKSMNKESLMDDFGRKRCKRKLWKWVDDEFHDMKFVNKSQELDPEKAENNIETGKEISGGDEILYEPKVQTFLCR